jgi:type II secretory pathway pseudopilin PulG
MKVIKVDSGVSRPPEAAAGFSRLELLAVLAVLALLAAIQFPALAHNKGNSRRAVCADNLRRLAVSWMMYADDNHGRLAPNQAGSLPTTNNWVAGWLDYNGLPDNTNVATITQARLYPYNKAVEIYRCPDDLSASRGQLRIRSYSMNGYVGAAAGGWSPGFQAMTKSFQIRQPDRTFIFIEEHPDSINDGTFILDMSGSGPSAVLIDLPSAYHAYGVHLGFADGSAQYRHWLDARTSPTPRRSPPVLGGSSPNNPDVAWLQGVTTYRQ